MGSAKARAVCLVHWAEDMMGKASVWVRLKHLRRFHEKVSIPAKRFKVDQPVRKTAREAACPQWYLGRVPELNTQVHCARNTDEHIYIAHNSRIH